MKIQSPGEAEQPQQDKYGTPMADVQIYVNRAVRKLGVDPSLVNDADSAMYAWRLNHQPKNVEVAQRILKMPDASLSQLARAMADTNPRTVVRQIENDPEYHFPPPRIE